MPSPASLAPPRADGLSYADLLDRARLSTHPATFPDALAVVLRDETQWGRVGLSDGVYRLVPDAFDQGVLAALRSLVL
jgi:hypothetical protein